ncbi:MAG: 50S ribosomal protein L17 [Opitutae bacterium]|jgi:large subunit ribosomal protein L17|nr:50S ribosomal protein L17 [Opitutae bacterium]
MRHSKRRHSLGVSAPHLSAMMGNLSVALITHGRIQTTLTKAKALRPFIEKIITFAKKAEAANDTARKLHFRRLAIARVRDKKAVAKLFDELASEFTERNGGYTRIYKVGQRIGDAAEMALIELIDGNDEGYSKKSAKKTAKKATKVEAEVTEAEATETEVTEAEATETEATQTVAKKTVKKAAKKAAKKAVKKEAPAKEDTDG